MKNRIVYAIQVWEWQKATEEYEPRLYKFNDGKKAKKVFNDLEASNDYPQITLYSWLEDQHGIMIGERTELGYKD